MGHKSINELSMQVKCEREVRDTVCTAQTNLETRVGGVPRQLVCHVHQALEGICGHTCMHSLKSTEWMSLRSRKSGRWA